MNLLKSIVAILSILGLIVYQYYFQTKDISLDEVWWITMSLSTAIFGFISITKKSSIFANLLVILCSVFYCVTTWIYVYRWCLQGDGSTNYYNALILSAVFTFLYLIYTLVEKYLKRLLYAIFGR